MNMWASAKSFTHEDLRKAFDDYAAAHGHELATSALERSTGARKALAVPQARIINAMVELVGGYSFAGRGPSPTANGLRRNLANMHDILDAIGRKAFGARAGRSLQQEGATE